MSLDTQYVGTFNTKAWCMCRNLLVACCFLQFSAFTATVVFSVILAFFESFIKIGSHLSHHQNTEIITILTLSPFLVLISNLTKEAQ